MATCGGSYVQRGGRVDVTDVAERVRIAVGGKAAEEDELGVVAGAGLARVLGHDAAVERIGVR